MNAKLNELNNAIDRFDLAIDQRWEQWRDNPLLDRLFYTASEAADFSLLWHSLGVGQAIIKDDPKIAVTLSAALGIESALLNGPIKSLFKRSRPRQETPRPHNLRQPLTSSFPSGHASAAMLAAALLWRGKYRFVGYGLGLIVAFSRVHVRIHHASDVLGGLVFGLIFAKFTRRLQAQPKN
ncbi:MAG: phosphatase PAP2 family protein [Acidimicrobiia bacterium]|nr:phosphatase PAP2 family protein [Acidimicrobiia bacterium]MCY4456499.1 phosphatase PAP2 family protein [Acidimicrobiaceae bacterium]